MQPGLTIAALQELSAMLRQHHIAPEDFGDGEPCYWIPLPDANLALAFHAGLRPFCPVTRGPWLFHGGVPAR